MNKFVVRTYSARLEEPGVVLSVSLEVLPSGYASPPTLEHLHDAYARMLLALLTEVDDDWSAG